MASTFLQVWIESEEQAVLLAGKGRYFLRTGKGWNLSRPPEAVNPYYPSLTSTTSDGIGKRLNAQLNLHAISCRAAAVGRVGHGGRDIYQGSLEPPPSVRAENATVDSGTHGGAIQ